MWCDSYSGLGNGAHGFLVLCEQCELTITPCRRRDLGHTPGWRRILAFFAPRRRYRDTVSVEVFKSLRISLRQLASYRIRTNSTDLVHRVIRTRVSIPCLSASSRKRRCSSAVVNMPPTRGRQVLHPREHGRVKMHKRSWY